MLNDLQNEVLKELVNIAFGKATGSLSELLDAFATLHVPHIEVFDTRELNRYLGSITENDETLYVSQQVYSGGLSGETLFMMNDKSVNNLAKHLYGNESITQNHIDDAVLEVNNILSVTTYWQACGDHEPFDKLSRSHAQTGQRRPFRRR
jgi:chemotaxis protein CheC